MPMFYLSTNHIQCFAYVCYFNWLVGIIQIIYNKEKFWVYEVYFSTMLMIGHILTNFRKKAWSRFSLIMHWRQLLRQCINSFALIVFCKGLKLSVDFKSEVTETYYFAYFCLCCLCLHMLMFYLSIYLSTIFLLNKLAPINLPITFTRDPSLGTLNFT